jgi:Ca2+/Na+ antiporter
MIMIASFLGGSSQFLQVTFLSAIISPYKQPELAANVFMWSITALMLLVLVIGWFGKKKHWEVKKTILILWPLAPLYFITVLGFLFSMWGGAIIFSLGVAVIYLPYLMLFRKIAEKGRLKIRQNIIKKIEENKSKGFTNKSMQENGLLPSNKTLLGYGFTEEQLKEFGLVD